MSFVVADFIMMPVGNALFKKGEDFRCDNDVEVVVMNSAGATYLLIYTLILFAYSFMIWFVFYLIPDRFGLISKRKHKRVDLLNRMTDQIHDDNIILNSIMNVSDADDVSSPLSNSFEKGRVSRSKSHQNS